MNIDVESLDLFDELAEKFRFSIVKNLKDCLKSIEVSDDIKEAICGEFLAELCVDLDQGEWLHKEKYYRPIVGFLSGSDMQFWGGDTSLTIPYQAYQHHDKAWEEIEAMYSKA